MKTRDLLITIIAGIIGGAIAFAVWPPLCILGMISAGVIAWFGIQWEVTRSQIRPALKAAGDFMPEFTKTLWHEAGKLDGMSKVTLPFALYCIYRWSSMVATNTVPPGMNKTFLTAFGNVYILYIIAFLHVIIIHLSDAAALKRGKGFWPRREKVPENLTNAAHHFCSEKIARTYFLCQSQKLIPLPNTLRNRYWYAALRIRDAAVYLCYEMWVELWHEVLRASQAIKQGFAWCKTFVISLMVSIISSERNIAGASSFLGVMVGYGVLGGHAPTMAAHLLGSLFCGFWSGVILFGLHRLGQRRFPKIYRRLQKVESKPR